MFVSWGTSNIAMQMKNVRIVPIRPNTIRKEAPIVFIHRIIICPL